MMNLNDYLKQVKLNREDPDYVIEDFWYGLKNSMIKFYKNNKISWEKVVSWSEKLNEYKKGKQYSLIEEKIKEYITNYAQDLILYEKNDDCVHSSILLTNIKRWNKLSSEYNFIDGTNFNDIVIIIFDSYCCIKKKLETKLEPILNVYKKINDVKDIKMIHISFLLVLGLQLGQDKLLESIIIITGEEKALSLINNYYEGFCKSTDKFITGRKLCKRFREKYGIYSEAQLNILEKK